MAIVYDDPPEQEVPQPQQQEQQQQQQAPPQPQPQRTWTWSQLLDTGSQGLSLANTATSAGFSTARFFTSTGIEIAKRVSQYSLALPAYAYDLANSADQSGSAARSVHSVVGALFDGVSMLALGAVDISGNITAAALGGAITGLSSISSAISSELARSLASFARLVHRNWAHVDDSLPPGGIPNYSVIQVTRALTAWVCIQLVTRPFHEKRILSGLNEINIHELEIEVKQLRALDQQQRRETASKAAAATASSTTDAPAGSEGNSTKPRITSESRIGDDGGDVITAEIGQNSAATPVAPGGEPLTLAQDATRPPPTEPDQPLTAAQTMLAFQRYSRLVLGIYGGMALRYMGVPVPQPPREEADSAGAAAQAAPAAAQTDITSTGAGVAPPPEVGGAGQVQDHATELKRDEDDFLAAAATLDLTSTYAEAEASGLFPGGWVSAPDGSDRIPFVQDPEDYYPENIPGSTAVERDHRTPGYITPPSAAQASVDPATATGTTAEAAPSFNVLDHDQRPPVSYSLIDLISGKHDDDVFHNLTGVRRGTAEAGVYNTTARNTTGRPVPSRPKFYVVTDHSANKVVLVLRGTLSFGDVAADLTCEAVPFVNMDASTASARARATGGGDDEELPDAPPASGKYHDDEGAFVVHEGMYHTALSVGGSVHAPVHRAVSRALAANPTYDLDIMGHSLGAGLAALLALLWVGVPQDGDDAASSLPHGWIGRTSRASGLPPNRRLHAYCFGVPCVMSGPLARRTAPFISSWTHSYDIVSRFSLGHVLDIRNACAWLAWEESESRAAHAPPPSSTSTAGAERRKAKKEARRAKKIARAESKRARRAARSGAAPPTAEQQQGAAAFEAAASAVADDAAAALADRGEPVVISSTEDEEEMDVDSEDEGEGEDGEDDEAAPTSDIPRRTGPPFDMTNLIKQAFAHIASAPRAGTPAASAYEALSRSSTTAPPPPAFSSANPAPAPAPAAQDQPRRPSAAQSAYDSMASFIQRATEPRFSSPHEEAEARRRTEEVFWSLRRTLEANMRHVELYPPGDVLITFEEGDLLRRGVEDTGKVGPRLFQLDDAGSKGMGKRQDVFGVVDFKTGFLARHLPHVYNQTLKDLLDR